MQEQEKTFNTFYIRNFLFSGLFAIFILAFLVFIFSIWFVQTLKDEEDHIFYISEARTPQDLNKYPKSIALIKQKNRHAKVLALKDDSSEFVILYSSTGGIYFTDENDGVFIDGDLTSTFDNVNMVEKAKSLVYLSRSDYEGFFNKSNSITERSVADTSIEGNQLERKKVNEKAIGSDNQSNSSSLSEAYTAAMKKKLESISSLPDVATIPVQTPYKANLDAASTSSSTMASHNNDLEDDSCLITFGGFNQPRIGFDSDCNQLSDSEKTTQIQTLINGFPDEFFIKHKAENERAEIYVFTDYTCAFCKKLHNKIDSFLSNGVSVNYIFYPRAIGSTNDDAARTVVTNMTSAWCSADPIAAVHQLYNTGYVPFAECDKNDEKLDSPVRQHYILGMMFDISGTPLIVGSNGQTTYGFRDVSSTLAQLKI